MASCEVREGGHSHVTVGKSVMFRMSDAQRVGGKVVREEDGGFAEGQILET